MKAICQDLLREYGELADLAARLSPEEWSRATDFYRWTPYDEIAHLYLFDELAVLAATDSQAFRTKQAEVAALMERGLEISQIARDRYANVSGSQLVTRWKSAFTELIPLLQSREPRDRLPWFGPDMSARSFATARLMETWAHGQDIYDALGIVRQPTERLFHIAHLGVVTFQWSYINRGLSAPEHAPLVELIGPAGKVWVWNEQSVSGSVRGTAQDFCLVVTQRRHVMDTALKTEGSVASEWLRLAQCFAGPPAEGPAAGVRKSVSPTKVA
jgi:uncharacterized protein (TIGR03084 family)